MKVEVRQAILEDRESIGVFLESAFPNRKRYPERWDWLNLRNPLITEGFGLPDWIAVLNARIIGHQGTMPIKVKIGDNTINGAWSIDTFVSPAGRGLGVAKKLKEANHSAYPLFLALEYINIIRGIWKKTGSMEGPLVTLLYRSEDILQKPLSQEISVAMNSRFGLNARLVEYVVKRTGLLKIICWILMKRIRSKQRRFHALPENLNLTLDPVTHFDEQADILWETTRLQYTFAVERTSTYLNWKYFEQPHMRHQCFYIKEQDEIVGILITRIGEPPEHPIGIICECYINKPAPLKYAWVIQKAISILKTQGAKGIWAATAEKEIEKIFVEKGFLRFRQRPFLIHFIDSNYYNEDIFKQILLGKGDHDWDQFPNLRQPSFGQFRMLAKGMLAYE